MKVTLIPKVREVPTLNQVSYEPAQGLVLRPDAASTLRVIASGTGNLKGEAWIEREGEVVGRTALGYDSARDVYNADIRLDGSKVPAGDYDVRAVLESTDTVTAPNPLHVILESPLDPALRAEVEEFRAYFDTDVYILSDQYRQAISTIATRLQPLSARIQSIRVEGHCDTRGTEVHNIELGSNRAASVAKILGDFLPGVVIGVQSLGWENPDPPGQNNEDWAMNRWARIRIESR
jgi:outer membrane protein OmpA-like peptidoglycan-associated protein